MCSKQAIASAPLLPLRRWTAPTCPCTHLAQRDALVPGLEATLHLLDGHSLPSSPADRLPDGAVSAIAQLTCDLVPAGSAEETGTLQASGGTAVVACI